MAKICKSCGAEYKGDYCDKCGYGREVTSKALEKMKKEGQKPVRFMTAEEKEAYYAKLKEKQAGAKKGKKKKAAKISGRKLAVVLFAAAAIVVVGLISTGTITLGSRTKVIERYFQAIEDRDYDGFVSAQHSKLRKEYDADLSELGVSKEKYMDKFCEDLVGMYGEDFKVSVEILSDPVKLSEKEKAEWALISTVTDLKDPHKVDIKATFSGSIKTEEADLTAYISKQAGSWKIFYIDATPIPFTEEEMQQGVDSSEQESE